MEEIQSFPLGRRERKKRETEERILQAALSLFQIKGLEATTLEEITEKADVGKGTFFNYFPTKEALFLHLYERVIAEVGGLLERQWKLLGNPFDILKSFLLLLAEQIQTYPDLFERMALKMARLALPSRFSWENLLSRLLKEGQERGELRKDIDPREMAEVVTAVGIQTILSWLREEPRPPLVGLLHRRLSLLWDGMRVRQALP
ncbi:MAG: TetR/AcrR family transcriptional regulator [Nitrospinae bacterium]|nr:TetR/AcrR family transcriptional regulator [Nitrospinota bacterium]